MKHRTHLKSSDRPALRVAESARAEIVREEVQRDNTTTIIFRYSSKGYGWFVEGRLAGKDRVFIADSVPDMLRDMLTVYPDILSLDSIVEIHNRPLEV